MGESIVDLVAEQLKKEEGTKYPKSSTKRLPISGGEVGGSKGFETFRRDRVQQASGMGLTADAMNMLVSRYGANVDKVLHFYTTGLSEAEEAGLDPIVFAMLRYSMEYESAYKPIDFFIRRTGALFFDIHWVHAHKEKVIAYMSKTLVWSEDQTEEYRAELEGLLYEATHPVAVSSQSTVQV